MPGDDRHTAKQLVAARKQADGAMSDSRTRLTAADKFPKRAGGRIVDRFMTTEKMGKTSDEEDAEVECPGGDDVNSLTSGETDGQSGLSIGERKMAMFLMTRAVDQFGQLTTTIEQIRTLWGTQEGHWSFGKTKSVLQSACGKFMGKGAEPGKLEWHKVRDVLVSAGKESDLPEAAYLFCEAMGLTEPPAGYVGEVVCPSWSKDKTVKVYTSFMVGGRDWALRFWPEDIVNEMDPNPPASGQDPQALTAAELQLRQDKINKLLAKCQDREDMLFGVSSELVRTLAKVDELENQIATADHMWAQREADLASREQEVHRLHASVGRAWEEQEEFRRDVESKAADMVRKIHGEAEAAKFQAQRERSSLVNENKKLRLSVLALSEDILASHRRTHPTASRETLLSLLGDALPPGISIEDLKPRIDPWSPDSTGQKTNG
ncbi:hypothetical protein [Umezawaea sp. Da 62-37]|uniref:hypothetical protein n=1 Tax=Umezawaea sp. Da 62-37 TaxID=3075927 RepID=UPI0028F742F1|nr:hypothetical protein [Umezawaea sp. Da 62-37]WNV86655.1 hypothetical protein RM788_52510 [Umezawaea sp. Da 62-37]WNV86762.1 hypothetical protein RM788_00295 [Umezawaea sp. Da 62-37]